MGQSIVDELKAVYAMYPFWLVTLCLVVVVLGLGWMVYKLFRLGVVIGMTALLVCVALFASWMFFAT